MNDKLNNNKTAFDTKKAVFSILKCAAFIFLWRLCITTVHLVHQYINITADADRYSEILSRDQNIITISATLIFFIAVLAIYAASGNRISEFFPLKKSKPVHFISAALLGISIHCVIRMTLLFFSSDHILDELSKSFNIGGGTLWMNLITLGIIIPLLEETLYRGLIFLRLNKSFPALAALLMSTALFAFSHNHIISIIYSTIAGVLFAAVLMKRMNILLVIIAHGFFNISSFITEYIIPSGFIPNFVIYIFYVIIAETSAIILIKNTDRNKQSTSERTI